MAQVTTFRASRIVGADRMRSGSLPQASPTSAAPTSESGDDIIRVLMVSSDPTDNQRLRLQAEERAIRKIVENARSRDGIKPRKVDIEVLPACTVDDLASKLLSSASCGKSPHIIHFSGHCDNVNHMFQLVLDEVGRAHGTAIQQSIQSSELGLKIMQDIAVRAAEDMNNFTVGNPPYMTPRSEEITDQSATEAKDIKPLQNIPESYVHYQVKARNRSLSTYDENSVSCCHHGREQVRRHNFRRNVSQSPSRVPETIEHHEESAFSNSSKKKLRRTRSACSLPDIQYEKQSPDCTNTPTEKLNEKVGPTKIPMSMKVRIHLFELLIKVQNEQVQRDEQLNCISCKYQLSSSIDEHGKQYHYARNGNSAQCTNEENETYSAKRQCGQCVHQLHTRKAWKQLDLQLAKVHFLRMHRRSAEGDRHESKELPKTNELPRRAHSKPSALDQNKEDEEDFPIARAQSITLRLPRVVHESHCLEYKKQLESGRFTAGGAGRRLVPTQPNDGQDGEHKQGSFSSPIQVSGCCSISLDHANHSNHPNHHHTSVVVTKKDLVEAGVGSLAFESELATGGVDFVSAKDFASLVAAHCPPVSCVVLNACNSGICGEQLVAHGVPIAVCSKGKLTDSGALKFSQGFYEALAMGNHIERAYAEGLLRIQLHEGTNMRKLNQLTTTIHESAQRCESTYELESGTVCLLKSDQLRNFASSDANLHVVATENMRMRGMIEQGIALLSEKDREIAKLQAELEKMKKKVSQQTYKDTSASSPTSTPGYARARNGVRRSRIAKQTATQTGIGKGRAHDSSTSNPGRSSRSAMRPGPKLRKPARESTSPRKCKDGSENIPQQPKAAQSTSAFGSSVPRFAGLAKDPTRYDHPKKASSTPHPLNNNLFGWT